jgi:hypothetical protein
MMCTSRLFQVIGVVAIATLLLASAAVAQEAAATDGAQAAAAAAPEKGPPLPFITIEGVGGGAITPMAYLVNPAAEGEVFGKPSAAFDYIGLGSKNLDTILVTENLYGRIEFGFAADRLGLGNLPGAIETATGKNIGVSDVFLYNFNLRGLVVKENADDNEWIPAVTVGVDFKTNGGIRDINTVLGGALNTIGYARENGTDFTVTATKTLPTGFFGKPLIVTAGLLETQGADVGFLGFASQYHAEFEGSVAILPFDKWLFAYEIRQQASPYNLGLENVNGVPLIGVENTWHAFDAAYIIDKHATLVAGVGIFGNLANTSANSAWWLQLKYEF